jgi:hypothetical protein
VVVAVDLLMHLELVRMVDLVVVELITQLPDQIQVELEVE